MKAIIVIAIMLLNMLANCLYAQDFTYFNKTYGGNDTINILAQAVRPIDDGYLVFGGYGTVSYKAFYIQKLNISGETVWFKDIEQDTLGIIGVIEHGGFVLEDNGALMIIYLKYLPSKDICLTKLNYNGDTLWQKCYMKPNNQIPKQIIKTLDGGYLISGMESKAAADTVSAYILKLDSMGNKQWDKAYQYGNDTRIFSAQQYYDSTYIFGAMTYTEQTKYDMFVIKTQANGDTIWTKRYGGNESDCACKIQILPSYEEYLNSYNKVYLMTGCQYVGQVKKIYISILDSMGGVIWQKYHNPLSFNSTPQSLPVILPDKSFIFPGYYKDNDGHNAPYIMRFDTLGNITWTSFPMIAVDGGTNVYIKDMQPITGGYVLAGYDYNIPQTAWVFTIDTLGNTCGVPDCAETIVGVEDIAPPPNSAPTLHIMPNPATTQATLYIAQPAAGRQLRIYNMSGQQVKNLSLPDYIAQYHFSVADLPAGVYVCKVSDALGQKLVVGK